MGMRLEVVPAGTEITNELTGEKLTVQEGSAVVCGSTMYLTKESFTKVSNEFSKDKAT